MRRYLLPILLLIATFPMGLKATHIVGGEIYYNYLGSDRYEINLELYMDCINGSPLALELDTIAFIAAFYSSNGQLADTQVVDTVKTTLIKDINYNCLLPPEDVCVVRYSYKAYMTLPDIKGGYTLAFQRCCRNNTIINIFDQDNTGGTYFVKIPERGNGLANSSPRFKQLPPNFLCRGKDFSFDHSAVDPDLDSLVYELCIPFNGGTSTNPLPRPPSPPPYAPVTMRTGFGVTNMMNANPHLAINPSTGKLTCKPLYLGQYVIGICVKEYRNGILLSTAIRDFQFNVIDCRFDVTSAFTLPKQNCKYQVDFKNKSQGAVKYKWNFGDPSSNSDTSELSTVSYTYPKSGWYTVKLIAYSTACSDTFFKEFYVKPDSGAFAGKDVRSCRGEKVKIGPISFFPNSSYLWTPNTYLDNDTLKNPTANPIVETEYILKQVFDYCTSYDTLVFRVGPPKMDITATPLPECQNMTYRFDNKSDGVTFEWVFNKKDSLYLKEPYYTFPNEGKQNVKFKSIVNPTCKDSLDLIIDVKKDTQSFAGPNQVVCLGDSTYLGSPRKYSQVKYLWSPVDYLEDPTLGQPLTIPRTSVNYILKRYTPYCEVYDSALILVEDPKPFFQLAYAFPCDGLNIKIYNKSTGLSRQKFDFGVLNSKTDTSTTSDSVSFTYPESGDYQIVLKGETKHGCRDEFVLDLKVQNDTGLFAGPDTNICFGQSIEIGRNDSVSLATYHWLPEDSVSNFVLPNPTILPSDSLWYFVEKKYPECTFTDSVYVGVHNPFAGFMDDYEPFCDLLNIRLYNTSTRFDSLDWILDQKTMGHSKDSIDIIFTQIGTQILSLIANKEHCRDTFQRSFNAFIDTGAFTIPDTIICLGDSIYLGKDDSVAYVDYTWKSSTTMEEDSNANPKVSPHQSTEYSVLRQFRKCAYTSTVKVDVAHPVALMDTFTQPDCFGFDVRFINKSEFSEAFQWQINNEDPKDSFEFSQIIPYGSPVTVRLIASMAHCHDSVKLIHDFSAFDRFKINAPNIFTPNGDGDNDCFYMDIPALPSGCKNAEIQIFNRWGLEVDHIKIRENPICWDGTNKSNGKKLTTGVYFYIVHVLGQEIHGTIHLIR